MYVRTYCFRSNQTTQLSPYLLVGTVLFWIFPAPTVAQTALDFTGTMQNAFEAELTLGWTFSVNETIAVDGLGFFDDFIASGREGPRP